MQKRILIAATAVLLSLPLALNAADENKKKGGGFTAADTDKDGKISKVEYTTALAARMDEKAATARFGELDKDKDGFLSREEFNAGNTGKKGGGKKKDS
ncbi:MAG TPA: EF-hand domain-containing protein [Opitutaceae bacterium]|nr:EF-hand domain-containing protein [Opitutaceae bacterium]